LRIRRVIAVGCIALGGLLMLVGIVLAFAARVVKPIPPDDELLPARDLLMVIAFFLPGIALFFLGSYVWSRSA
jgi:hypothetical protein